VEPEEGGLKDYLTNLNSRIDQASWPHDEKSINLTRITSLEQEAEAENQSQASLVDPISQAKNISIQNSKPEIHSKVEEPRPTSGPK
jgi:hypothetical protein